MRLAIFVTRNGVEKVIPDTDGLEETDEALVLYRTIHEEIARFDKAVRQQAARSLHPSPAGSVVS